MKPDLKRSVIEHLEARQLDEAQLRLHDDAGRIKTLYQVPYDASRFGVLPDIRAGESPWSAQVRGLTVELWVEKGLLFAQTRE